MSRPPIVLSNSSMKALACPFHFQRRYLLAEEPEPTSRQAWKGSLGHQAIARYISYLYARRRTKDWEKFGEIIGEVVDGVPEDVAEAVYSVCDIFAAGFRLKPYGKHYTERLLAMDRDFNPIPVYAPGEDAPPQPAFCWSDALHRVLDPPIDGYTGQVDYVHAHHGGKIVDIYDWKLGQEHVTEESVRTNVQGMLYCALWMAHHPECEKANFILWGVRYGAANQEHVQYRRDAVFDAVKQRGEHRFALLDAIWEIPGAWPAVPASYINCNYCTNAQYCQVNRDLLESLASRGPIVVPRRPARRNK